MSAQTVKAPAATPLLDLFGSPAESVSLESLRGDPQPLPASRRSMARRAVAFPSLPVGHPMREREMVCALTGDLGLCPRPTGALGPVDVCRQEIGTIGYQLGGVVICWSCFVRAVAAERAAKEAALKRDAAPESGLAEVGGVLADGVGEAER